MAKQVEAQAQPEKRLFVHLITRDITLLDAFLDLADNSVNSAINKLNLKLRTPDDYFKLKPVKAKVAVNFSISSNSIIVEDDAGGIEFKTAKDHVFNFGSKAGGAGSDRLSVYGIGLKRALFKCGNIVKIRSEHESGGFEMLLNVSEWEKEDKSPWTLKITPLKPSKKTGTKIEITELYQDVSSRIKDGVFLKDLKKRISNTYIYYIDRIVRFTVNKDNVEPSELMMSSNIASEEFTESKVSCLVAAGIGQPKVDRYEAENSGWFIFCNGRAVVLADKTELTGWGTLLPTFQPKHRPFLGFVFFSSVDPELLPWTTTKTDINEESLVWQRARRTMASVGRQVTRFLDRRYGDAGTTVTPSELTEIAGGAKSLVSSKPATKHSFDVGAKRIKPKDTSVQYRVPIESIERVKRHLGKASISNSEVGRYTYDYFFENEIENS